MDNPGCMVVLSGLYKKNGCVFLLGPITTTLKIIMGV